ncbi:MAG: protoporphyrinogen oxidase HemJ [Gammaproteobacteria bacterium]|nr:protoporphyrinogen oxidase HemJ [Gammaproteobacteria bacterium]MCP5318081.1 protoporphyrinogen oxidase HemJ [Chromatiaceae bacterium]MCW5584766.1 protoporphyrinogen oxidase HemJ [Chromatiales bacterium]MCB1817802.1 protoporphyrinogen oxidase HemJ [Gammaproteobacteria bacterium]MCP5429922.1 protoporphyrinogen oxidase HemJ [Chromatiaceae bacterium]
MWLKAWHLIGMVTWFAGLFYLPRLFVYHTMSDDQVSIDRFKVMERKLFFGITTPGAVFTLVFGFWMLHDYAWAAFGDHLWLHIKLALLGVLVAYHIYCGKLVADFKHDRNRRSHVWYRWFNELPVLLLIAIVLLAVLKPV